MEHLSQLSTREGSESWTIQIGYQYSECYKCCGSILLSECYCTSRTPKSFFSCAHAAQFKFAWRIMKLLLLSSFLCAVVFSGALSQTYYITPDNTANETCSVNDNFTTLTPCYSLQQLCEDRTLISNKTHLTLLLLPGTHVIPQGHTLTASDVQELGAFPWSD